MQRGSLKPAWDARGVKVWRAQWRENGAGRTRYLGRCADMSRAEARAELDKILIPLHAKVSAPAGTVTLLRYTEDEYLSVKTRVWKASTRATTEQIISTHILSEIGKRLVASITRKELQMLLDRKAASGLSHSVVGHVRWQLVAIFEMAQGDGIVTVNPTSGLVTPVCAGTVNKAVLDIASILRGQLVLDIRERLIYSLAVREGLRPSEIVGLQLGDYREGLLYIERRVYRGKQDTPKSDRSRRRLSLTGTTATMLAHYLELFPKQKADAWIFPSATGNTPVSYSSVYRNRMQPALNTVGLGHVNFQMLRRTWVTELAEVEDDPAIRAKMAGHCVDVHENEYRQAKPEALKRAADKMDKRLQ